MENANTSLKTTKVVNVTNYVLNILDMLLDKSKKKLYCYSTLLPKLVNILKKSKTTNTSTKTMKSQRTSRKSQTSHSIIAKKAITSIGYETNLLLLDMSTALDTIKGDLLIEDLKEVLNNDETHLVALLLENVELSAKLENLLGSAFKNKYRVTTS